MKRASAGRVPDALWHCAAAKGVTGVNFPLSTYSAFGEKNVSQENKNNLPRIRPAAGCLRIRASYRASRRSFASRRLSFCRMAFEDVPLISAFSPAEFPSSLN
jgi:hypothetical protein